MAHSKSSYNSARREMAAPRPRPAPVVGQHTAVGAALAPGVRRAFAPTRRNLLHWASWAVTLGAEVLLTVLLADGDIYGWEVQVARWLQEAPAIEPVFSVSSTLTNTLSLPFAALFITILAIAWKWGTKLEVALLALSFPLHVLAQFPKALIDRPRPPAGMDSIEGVGGLQSFPSGHSEYVITFYGFLAFMLVARCTRRRSQAAIVGVWLALVLATGFGRVAAGRHWPLDVLASYAIGVGLLSGLIWLYFAFREVNSTPEDSTQRV